MEYFTIVEERRCSAIGADWWRAPRAKHDSALRAVSLRNGTTSVKGAIFVGLHEGLSATVRQSHHGHYRYAMAQTDTVPVPISGFGNSVGGISIVEYSLQVWRCYIICLYNENYAPLQQVGGN